VTPDEIEIRLCDLYGTVDWPKANGVIHVAAMGAVSQAVIIPGENAPVSETDRFILAAARARADAIVTTGAILRSEPELRHVPSSFEAENSAFREWRCDRLERSGSPQLIILSASGDFPLEHPALDTSRSGFVWTTEEGATNLRRRAGARLGNLEIIVGSPTDPAVLGAIDHAQVTRGMETILIEAGPSASASLYSRASLDTSTRTPGSGLVGRELLLSRFEDELAAEATGPAFPSRATVAACFATPPSETQIEDASGHWSIMRYRFDGVLPDGGDGNVGTLPNEVGGPSTR